MFFRNSLVSDLFFTVLFVLCMNFGRSPERSPRAAACRALRKPAMQPPEQRDEVEMLSLMLLIRRFEERASQQYQAQKIGGFCHLYIGQEAVVVRRGRGARDRRLPHHRLSRSRPCARPRHERECVHGRAFRQGDRLLARPRRLDAFLRSRKTTCTAGTPLSGAHVPLAAGMAFASKYRDEDRVTLCFFGDGAINQGAFHEALNLAALYKLPVIFICENNLFAMGTSREAFDFAQANRRSRGRLRHPGEIVSTG